MDADEVNKQLRQMVTFIEKEAREKANEIKVKAEEEFNIEKQKIVKAERQRIQKEFERKEKQVEVKKKIKYSNELNQSRLKVLKARDDAVRQIFQEASKNLASISSNAESYKKLMLNLIVQGLIKMDESEVELIARKVDVALVESLQSEVLNLYKKTTNKTCKLEVSKKHFLSPPPTGAQGERACCGGILLSAHAGRILCNNTLEQRLQLSYEAMLPEIRTTLFGASLTRVYYD
mmetsp:Transcript_39596/g.99804  ORF Transcript_39596/g.99804 Transcript_39596/m.99804 type:complete len:234 (+) Transcript_39596:189-890(+)|eukprot:CAMPEP_0177649648 /NCGR_PEP_ID=MMETSP0447-20121125/11507_1 /TAXON_ID=0 /ORGANISM="Stygamoeba regulata, Strain BSH-02190019" /LENGTH=233 /DNA_ID=CAMNT_0019152437 /DNA_START=166 /DNA_END=867 /DNA_ORIENTATION=+